MMLWVGKRTAGPSALLGMTKGRAVLTSTAVTEGWKEAQAPMIDYSRTGAD
jgi:hypothetical protein